MTNLMVLSKPIPLKFTIFLPNISPSITHFIKGLYITEPLQRLSNLIENNPWHDHEPVLTHVETVFANLQILLSLNFVDNPKLKHQYSTYLHSPLVDNSAYTRQDLLLLACALHDVSKGVIGLINNPDGTTSATGHEHASALFAPKLLEPLNLLPADHEYVINLIDKHNTFRRDFCETHLSPITHRDPQSDASTLKQTAPNLTLELLLHISADEFGAPITQNLRQYLLNEVIAKISVI